MKTLISLGIIGAVGKVVFEKSAAPIVVKAERALTEWRCDLDARHQAAVSFQKQARTFWASGDRSSFDRAYQKALDIYTKTGNECGSAEAYYQLGLAFCRGYGVPKNVALGQDYLKKVGDDQRLFELKRSDPEFCQSR